MNILRFIAVLIEIIIKGCKESPAIKTTLILLISVTALIFVPHWIGLLVIIVLPGAFAPIAWVAGLLCILTTALVTASVITIYMLIYEHVR